MFVFVVILVCEAFSSPELEMVVLFIVVGVVILVRLAAAAEGLRL